jgi:hypothetical protein
VHILRLAARAPCRSGPVTSTLGRTFAHAPAPAHSPGSSAAVPGALRSGRPRSVTTCRHAPSSCLPAYPKVVTIGRYAPASVSCDSGGQQVSCGWRFAPACCAAQSVRGRAACATPAPLGLRRAGGAMGHRPGKATGAASASAVLATPLSTGLLFCCQRHKARPNMSVNRSLHGMPPWPRSARCPCCASRPGRHAVPARLPLR